MAHASPNREKHSKGMLGGEHVADVSFSQRPKETTERKVSLMLILCTDLRSLPYLAVNHCYCNAHKTPAVPKQRAQQDQSRAQPSDSGYHCSPAQAPVALCCFTCCLQLNSSGWELSLCSKCGTGRGVESPRWGEFTA